MNDSQAELDLINKRIRYAKIAREGLETQVRRIQARIENLKIEIRLNEAKAKRLYCADVPK